MSKVTDISSLKKRIFGFLLTGFFGFLAWTTPATAQISGKIYGQVQRKVVKIFGAGGFSRLKGYGTGFVVSPQGDIVTVWSPVLDTPRVDVVFSDGKQFEAELKGVDPRKDLAVLKLVISNGPGNTTPPEKFDYFDLEKETAPAEAGSRILAFSNMFRVATGDEPVTVVRGVVSSRSTLFARRGRNEISFDGPVYLLDTITNNSGAAGGVVVNPQGHLVGVIGKELKNSRTNTWTNYAMPIDSLTASIRQLISGESENLASTLEKPVSTPQNPVTSRELGLITVPQVVVRTPAYIDAVIAESPAAQAGLQPDDLIVFLNDRIVSSCREWEELLASHPRDEKIRIVVRRTGRLVSLELEPPHAEK